MRALRTLLVSMLALVVLGGLLAPSASAANAKTRKFCEAVRAIGTSPSSGVVGDGAGKLADAFRAAGKAAPKKPAKVRKSLKTLAELYDRASQAQSVNDMIKSGLMGEILSRSAPAVSTYVRYYSDHCLQSGSPTTSATTTTTRR